MIFRAIQSTGNPTLLERTNNRIFERVRFLQFIPGSANPLSNHDTALRYCKFTFCSFLKVILMVLIRLALYRVFERLVDTDVKRLDERYTS